MVWWSGPRGLIHRLAGSQGLGVGVALGPKPRAPAEFGGRAAFERACAGEAASRGAIAGLLSRALMLGACGGGLAAVGWACRRCAHRTSRSRARWRGACAAEACGPRLSSRSARSERSLRRRSSAFDCRSRGSASRRQRGRRAYGRAAGQRGVGGAAVGGAAAVGTEPRGMLREEGRGAARGVGQVGESESACDLSAGLSERGCGARRSRRRVPEREESERLDRVQQSVGKDQTERPLVPLAPPAAEPRECRREWRREWRGEWPKEWRALGPSGRVPVAFRGVSLYLGGGGGGCACGRSP